MKFKISNLGIIWLFEGINKISRSHLHSSVIYVWIFFPRKLNQTTVATMSEMIQNSDLLEIIFGYLDSDDYWYIAWDNIWISRLGWLLLVLAQVLVSQEGSFHLFRIGSTYLWACRHTISNQQVGLELNLNSNDQIPHIPPELLSQAVTKLERFQALLGFLTA